MGQRTRYEPGTFSWTDLTTPGQAAAGRFYAELLGWTLEDVPAGENVVYTMASVGGDRVAAISPQPEQQRAAGVPPLWNSYITVAGADDALARIGEHGGSVHAGAFDVFDNGRMGVAQDPQGAFFMVWEPKSTPGAGLVNAPGAMCWNELGTTDLEGAKRFYGQVFGWTFETLDMPAMEYAVIRRADGGTNGGMYAAAAGGPPPAWLVYFACDALDPALERLRELGGELVNGPTDIGMARIAVVRDPQGGTFALYDGRLED